MRKSRKDKSSDLEVRDIILAYEKQCDPFKYQFEGFCIWPVVRFITFENMKINSGGFSPRSAAKNRDKLVRVMKFIPEFIRNIMNVKRLHPHKDKVNIIAFSSKGRWRDKINGVSKNMYFDFFDPQLRNIMFWDMYEDRLDRFYSLFFNEKKGIIRRFSAEFKSGQHVVIKDLYKDFTEYLRENGFGDYFDTNVSRWKSKFKAYISQKCVFESLLKELNPKMLLVECSYGKEGAVAASKSLNVPVWELQHGVFYDGHMAYTYDQKPAGLYKHQLPLPDKILTYGKYFSGILIERGFWDASDVPEIGFPRLEYFKQEYSQKREDPVDNLIVLISSQWIIADELVSFLKDVVPALSEGIRIQVKPHPLELDSDTSRYRALGNKIEIIHKDVSFYNALSECHVHCSVFSTTLFESIGMGVPTIIINLPGAEHVYSIVENGCGKIAGSPLEFMEMLQRLKNNKHYLKEWRSHTEANQGYFWGSDPGEKIQKLFSEKCPGIVE